MYSISSMVRVQKRIAVGMEVLQYFTMRGWNFKIEKLKSLISGLSEEDSKKFFIQNIEMDIENYMIQVLLGARQYCMKEPLINLDRARYHLKLWVVLYIYKCIDMCIIYYTHSIHDNVKTHNIMATVRHNKTTGLYTWIYRRGLITNRI